MLTAEWELRFGFGDELLLPEAALAIPTAPGTPESGVAGSDLAAHYTACEAASPAAAIERLRTRLQHQLDRGVDSFDTTILRQVGERLWAGYTELGGASLRAGAAETRFRTCRRSLPPQLDSAAPLARPTGGAPGHRVQAAGALSPSPSTRHARPRPSGT